MQITFFHWGVHAWAIYAVVGLGILLIGMTYLYYRARHYTRLSGIAFTAILDTVLILLLL